MHQFHDWIMTELLKVYQNTQASSATIHHKWQSDGTILSQKRHSFDVDESEEIVTETPFGINHRNINVIHKVPPRDTFRVAPEQTAKYMIRSSPQPMVEEEQILSEDSDAEEW